MKRKEIVKPDYRALFFMGITFTGASVAIGLLPLAGLGIVLMAVGLANRGKWP